ncbi:MAG TPA: sulfotransferase domain-containing protein [Acidimicrobiia bacterium]|nr:sulfotransferase domain-containing protein [Acidimicrobiia bacterium]
MDSHEPPLPTFLIIGAQKSATRWLRLNLGLHPDVYSAPGELEFFNNIERSEHGVAAYRAQFEGWSGEPYVGEATPGYMFWRHDPRVVAGRIRDTVPDVRLIAILRNPVDRAHSAVVHHIEGGSLPAGAQVMDVVRRTPPERDPLGIVSGGWYAASLEPYVEFFGDRLLVLLHDDADDDPRGVYDRALRHVGPAPDFVPAELERVRFSYQQRPSAEGRELTLDERRELYEFFADDILKLEKMTGRDLSLWEPDAW